MTNTEMENRLMALEREVAQLKAERSAANLQPVHQLQKIHGTFENDKALKEALRLAQVAKSSAVRD